MSNERWVWFQPLGYLGEAAIDLFSCLRFVLSVFDKDKRQKTHILYLTKQRCWIDQTGDVVNAPSDPKHGEYVEQFREIRRETAAFVFLSKQVFRDELPEELEPYRPYGDPKFYHSWLKEHPKHSRIDSIDLGELRPRWDGVALMFGAVLCKKFARQRTRQAALLDEFERLFWVSRIRDPFDDPECLRNTVNEMNRWPNSPLVFRQNRDFAFWRAKGVP